MDTPIRLLVSDIDGTLVRADKSLASATIAAAKRLIAAGGRMTLISARPPSGILPLARELGLTSEVGAFNGGTVVALDGTIRVAHRLDAAISRAAVTKIEQAGTTCWAFADNRWFSSDGTNPHTASERKASMQEPVLGTDFAALHGRIDKIVAVTDDRAEMKRLTDRLKAALGDGANVSNSQTYYCDVTHPLANKGDGIATLADAIGVPLAETASIGDMPNDLPMLARAALPIAMGQAPDEVKAAAKEVSTSNEEDGVANAIDRFVLPRLAED
ncbi:Cof-type HAD-IIB family hydrolase [Sphingomonas sp.]|uniref:Cof-type HAD-IIB family hydrolase n=1 Tax=Sphingomonas sp. TaxID=28214 RepID=UPI003AFF8600